MLKDKIKERLKARLLSSGVNLSQKRIDAIADRLAAKVTEESGIDQALDDMDGFYPFADMAKDDDRVRTLEANQKKKEDPTEPPAPPKPDDDDTPAWAKSLLQKVESLEQSKQVETFSQKATAKLKEKNIPDAFSKIALKNLNVKSDEELDALIGEIEANYVEFKQSSNDQRLEQAEAPMISGSAPDTVKSNIKAWGEGRKSE